MPKQAWLIGASDGIGAALAIRLAKDGYKLALSARNVEQLELLSLTLTGTGHLVVPLDVRDPISVIAAWKTIEKNWAELGEPQLFIYSAGAYEPMSAKAFDLNSAETMVEVNLTGAFRALGCILPLFIARDSGHIVLIGSVAGYRGLPNAIGYGASKAAINHLAENLKLDLCDTKIKVQRVCPSFVKTRLTNKNDFSMPFLVSPEIAADRIADGLKSTRFEIRFPWQMALISSVLSLLPPRAYFAIVRHLR